MQARVHLRVFFAFLLAAVALAQSSAPAQLPGLPAAASFQGAKGPKYVPGEVLVRFRSGASKAGKGEMHASVRAQVVRRFKVVRDLEVVRLPEGMPVEAAVKLYRRSPDVLYAEPNYTWHAIVIPTDPQFGQLWGLHNTGQSGGIADADIDAPEAWDLPNGTGSSNVVVGIIDTGIDYTHEDLAANMFQNVLDCNSNGVDDDGNGFIDDCYGIDTFNGDSDPMDDHSHGTHVAGTIGAVGNNGVGVVGVNWNVRLIACKFLGSGGSGSTAGAIACLEYFSVMRDRGVNIVTTNNSWGGGPFSQALLDAIDAHRQRGILFIAAAGNANFDNDTGDVFPANYYLPNVISVAATTRIDARASFSDFGRRTVHLGAPGDDILSTTPNNTYSVFSGTSMATPHVAGAAALLAAQDPLRDYRAIKNLLLAGGDTNLAALTSTISQKRLNARGALDCSSLPNPVVLSRLRPVPASATTTPGLPLNLAALHINCANPNGNVDVSVSPGGETITLTDNGLGFDQQAGDGIYSGQWVPAATGTFTLTFPGNDVVAVQVLTPYQFSSTAFSYRTITGTNLFMSDDSSSVINPPFPIQFGGSSFSSVYVSSNGNLNFQGAFTSPASQPLPYANRPTLVAPFWDDLYPTGTTQQVFWQVTGTTPNRELVIEWRDLSHFVCAAFFGDTTPSVRFQVVLFESSSDILFNYADTFFGGDCAFADAGATAAVGVQVASLVAAQFSFGTPSLADNTAILWTLGSPTPLINALSPFSALTGSPTLTIKVTGENFVPGTMARWNGADRSTTFVSSKRLDVIVPDTDLAAAGTGLITASSPSPGGGVSNNAAFTVYDTYPPPSVTSVSPDALLAGQAPVTLIVTGNDFVDASVVRWDGANRPTVVLDSTRAQGTISLNDSYVAGPHQLTVFTPVPGGGTSDPPLTVQIDNPLPAPFFLQPDAVAAGGPNFTLEVFGVDFVPSSVVRWNGADRPTTFVNGFELQAAIPASDIAAPGSAQVTVFNPVPGGGLSSPLSFDVVLPAPNDAFANALQVSTLPFAHATDSRGATTEPADPSPPCGNGSREKSVWYQFTPTSNALVTGTTFGSNYDTILSAWTGSPGSFASVQCNDDAVGLQSQISFTPTPGTTYSFMVSDYAGIGGSLVFNLTQPDFALSSSGPSSVTVTRGGTANYTIRVTPASGITTPITFSCGQLPAGTACNFSRNPLTPGPAPEDVNLAISTQAPSAFLIPPFGDKDSRPLWAFWLARFGLGLPGLAVLGLMLAGGTQRKRVPGYLLILLALLLAIQVACGGGSSGGSSRPPPNPGTPLGTHNITVNATSAGIVRSMTVTLVVQ